MSGHTGFIACLCPRRRPAKINHNQRRMKYDTAYLPPSATGTLTDTTYWGTAWAEQAYQDGLLPSCGTGKPLFCPNELVTRGWAAYLVVKTKGTPTP